MNKTLYNHDIISMLARLQRYMKEMNLSVSSNLSELSVADRTRLESYIENIKKFKAWVIEQPELDLPESSPRAFTFEDADAVVDIENLDITQIGRLLNVLMVEMASSQSARKPAGMTVHDSLRFDTIVTKIESFLADFIGEDDGLDLPESSPKSPMSGVGNTGV